MKLSPNFVKQLQESAVNPAPEQKYKCQNCHRPDLDVKFVAFISRGEAYCKPCVGGAK